MEDVLRLLPRQVRPVQGPAEGRDPLGLLGLAVVMQPLVDADAEPPNPPELHLTSHPLGLHPRGHRQQHLRRVVTLGQSLLAVQPVERGDDRRAGVDERGDEPDRLGELGRLDRNEDEVHGGRRLGARSVRRVRRVSDGEPPVPPIDPYAVPRQPLRPLPTRDESHPEARLGEVHGIHRAHRACAHDGNAADLPTAHPVMVGGRSTGRPTLGVGARHTVER